MGLFDRALSFVAGVPSGPVVAGALPMPASPQPAEVKAYNPGDPGFMSLLLGWNRGSKSGVEVTVTTALQVSAVLACVRVIAEGLAQVPCKVVQIDAEKRRREARDHPLWALLYRMPNALQTSFEFREQIALHLALCGNAYVLIIRDSRGRPQELLPFEPGMVTVRRNTNFTLSYTLRGLDGREIMVPAADVWHLRGLSWNGSVGLDTLTLVRNAVGLGVAAEEYGSEMFANGARPQGILTTDSDVGPEKLLALRAAWQEANTGSGQRFQTVAMTNGLKWQAISQSAHDTQMIEARRFQIEEIARGFRVNPVMIMQQMNNMAYASVEQLFLAHVTHTLGPWFERFEQSAECSLFTAAERAAGYEIELMPHSLLRGTAKDTADTLAVMRQNGAITGNEMREGMDMARGTDPALDTFEPAAHLFGNRAAEAEPAAAPAPARDEEMAQRLSALQDEVRTLATRPPPKLKSLTPVRGAGGLVKEFKVEWMNG
jgi:HK97 family phage portal protein